MLRYVDGFVIPIPKKKLAAYKKMASLACKVSLGHGALDYQECVIEDGKAPFACPFAKGIRSRKGETIMFSYIAYKSRAHRDRVNTAVMKDPRLNAMCDPKKTSFDVKRMLYGGFEAIVSA